MSGHSKWNNIKRKKEASDAKKANIFSKLGKEITIAVKTGNSGDINVNRKLKDVVAKAKAQNMPNDNINRCIQKAIGDTSAANYEEITYEGFGPCGVSVIVEALTDNKNRTAANVRNCFTKGHGSIGTQGCVSYMFDEKGQIIIDKEDCDKDADDLMMMALDAGAEDFEADEECYTITTTPEDFSKVREALEEQGIEFLEAEVQMVPTTYVALDEKAQERMDKLLENLDELDDVMNVYHNSENN